MTNILQEFCAGSGLMVNLHKSKQSPGLQGCHEQKEE